MADDTAVIRQELANISGQLLEMQATMMLWMSQQADTAVAQEKKTSPLPSKYAVWPYESRRSRRRYPQAGRRSGQNRQKEIPGQKSG